MMITELMRQSNVATVLSEEYDDETQAGKAVVRVLDQKAWIRVMTTALEIAAMDDSCGLEVHKVFHVVNGNVQFAWMVIYWGMFEPSMLDSLTPIFSRRVAAPPPFALGKGAKGAAAPQAEVPRRGALRVVGEPQDTDSEEVSEVRLGSRKGKNHRTKFRRDLPNGTKEFEIPLSHVRTLFTANEDPNEILRFGDTRRRFKAVVQQRGEAEFSPQRGGKL